MRSPLMAIAIVLLFILPTPQVDAAPELRPPVGCEPDAYVYKWRDAHGRLQMGDCAPEGAGEVARIRRSSLQPTLIQPPRVSAPSRKTSPSRTRKKGQSTRRKRLSARQRRALSVKCRWLVGRVEHLRDLVAVGRDRRRGESIWQQELRRWRAEMRKERCGVRL